MAQLTVRGKTIELDKDGYLKELNDWSEDVANALAANEPLELTEAHWEIIRVLQEFYKEFELSPAMRPLIKYVGLKLGPEKGKSIYLMKLFGQHSGQSPALVISKLAGLPRPTNCL